MCKRVQVFLLVKWRWKFLEKLPNPSSECFNSWSRKHQSKTLLSLKTGQLETLNFCKIWVCTKISYIWPDPAPFSHGRSELQSMCHEMHFTRHEYCPSRSYCKLLIISLSAGKNKSNPSRAQGHKEPLDRQDFNTSIWQWQQQPLHIPTSQSSGKPHLQKFLPLFLPSSLIKLQRVNKKYSTGNILMSLHESIGHFKAVGRYFKSRSLLRALHIFSQHGFVGHFTQGQSPEIYSRSSTFNQIQIICLKKDMFQQYKLNLK